jgi:hypothetical protein
LSAVGAVSEKGAISAKVGALPVVFLEQGGEAEPERI